MSAAGWGRGVLTAIWALAIAAGASALEVEVLQDSGDPQNRIDIAILGDGYRLEDQKKLTDDAASFLKDFWAESPFSKYRAFFNVKLIHVISNENGADNGSYGDLRDTALGAYYGCFGVDRLICLGNASAMWQILGENVPEYDDVFVLVNDPKYGGAGGPYSVLSTHDQAPQIACHEYGHSLGLLADEYSDPYPGYPGCNGECPEPNVTTNIDRATIKWGPWVKASTPLPTPDEAAYDAAVGAFEGARYQSSGVYRPVRTCMMRRLGYDFCPVCAEALVRSVYDRTAVIDRVSPSGNVQLELGESIDLTVETPLPSPDTMEFTWIVDKESAPGARKMTVSASGLGLGSHEVGVRVRDETALVRSDPGGRLTGTHTWNIEVVPEGAGTDDDTACDTDTGTGDGGTDTDGSSDSADTGTDTASGSDTDVPFDTDPQSDTGSDDSLLCEPSARRCIGLFEYEVCDEGGGAWSHGGYCDADQRCTDGECVELDYEESGSIGGVPKNSDDCGCRVVGRYAAGKRSALSLVLELLRL